MIILVPALTLMLSVSMLEPRHIWRLASLMFLGSLFFMVFVLFSGMEIKGAKRWVHLFGFSLQPSEFAKPAFAIVAAWLMAAQKNREKFPGNAITAGLYFNGYCFKCCCSLIWE